MLPVNTLLQGRYLIVEQIGRGGMGAVYKATDTRLRATVALKETLVAGDPARRAFEREAQLLAGLRHSALPRVSDHFMEGDGQFLVMEFIPGDDLAAMLVQRGGPFPADDVLRWADQLLDALDYLHSQQPPIIHRDIKPQNTKLTARGEIILLDFGLAKGAAAQMSRMTSTGSIFGYTPHYAPLEQIQGTGTGPRSDLYSLAATLHHLLTGAPPPDALTRAAAKINDDPDPLQPADAINPAVPPAVAAVLARALAQKPDQRPATAVEMRAMLRAAAQGQHPTAPLAGTAPISSAGAATIASPPGPMVIVAPTQVQAHSTVAGSATPTAAPLATGTTITPRPTIQLAPQTGNLFGKTWFWVAVAAVLAVLVGGGLFAFGGSNTPATTTAEPILAALPTTGPPTEVPATNTPAPTIDILQAAASTQTAIAVQQAAVLATARVVLNATDFAATQTAIALTPTVTPPPTEAAPEPTAAPQVVAAQPTSPPPANTPRPAGPTRAPAPTRPSAPTTGPQGAILDAGGAGKLFTGSSSKGDPIDPATSEGGSCIQGRVRGGDSSLFESFYVQVDNRGRTIPAKHFPDTGNYRICGLDAGEWGVAVYAVNNQPTSDAERVAHQVRVRATGTPGEIFYVNFTGSGEFRPPTSTPEPTAIPPTPPPPPSPYDGQWSGRLSGKTAGDVEFNGSFRMEVRAGAIYSIAIDGPSCLFETYPNFPNGRPIDGNAFAVSGSPFHPTRGADNSINYTINGVFGSSSQASGQLNATQNGGSCAVASWSAAKR
jgi:eukaryotic-like serine/threonine-protein kinase